MEQIKEFYQNSRWGRPLVLLGLVLASALLALVSDGFPPWAWRFLFSRLPQLPSLWAGQGAGILPPFIGLLLLSLSLLLAWGTIAVLTSKIVHQWWQDYHARQHFQLDLQEAERLAEINVAAASDDAADLSWFFESDANPPASAARVANNVAQPIMRYNRSYQKQPINPNCPVSPQQPVFPSNDPYIPASPNPALPPPAAQMSPQLQPIASSRPQPVRSARPTVSEQTSSPLPAAAFAQRPVQAPTMQPGTRQQPHTPMHSKTLLSERALRALLNASKYQPAPPMQARTWQQPSLAPRGNVVPARPSPIWGSDDADAAPLPPRAPSPMRQQLRVVPPPVDFDEEMEEEEIDKVRQFDQADPQLDKNTSDYGPDYLDNPDTSRREFDISNQHTSPDWIAQLEALAESGPPQSRQNSGQEVPQSSRNAEYSALQSCQNSNQEVIQKMRNEACSASQPRQNSNQGVPQSPQRGVQELSQSTWSAKNEAPPSSRKSVVPAQPALVPQANLGESRPQTAIDLETTLPLRQEDQEALRRPAGDVRADPLPGDHEEAHTAPVRLVVGVGLDPGIARRNQPNEDSLFAIQGQRISDAGAVPAGLFVVADGMGGHANGREASKRAIQTVSDAIVPTLLREASGTNIIEDEQLFVELLKDGVHRANLAIYQRNRELPEMMGTTLTSALVVDDTAYIANIGDSRTYLYRPGEGLRPVTRDHSRVADMVSLGLITPDEVYTHPQRNQIYRCLGERATAKVDTFVEQVQPGDILLLCSDGLWEMVRDPDIERIIASSAHNPAQISSVLVQAALHRGGADNISVVVVGIAKNG